MRYTVYVSRQHDDDDEGMTELVQFRVNRQLFDELAALADEAADKSPAIYCRRVVIQHVRQQKLNKKGKR